MSVRQMSTLVLLSLSGEKERFQGQRKCSMFYVRREGCQFQLNSSHRQRLKFKVKNNSSGMNKDIFFNALDEIYFFVIMYD